MLKQLRRSRRLYTQRQADASLAHTGGALGLPGFGAQRLPESKPAMVGGFKVWASGLGVLGRTQLTSGVWVKETGVSGFTEPFMPQGTVVEGLRVGPCGQPGAGLRVFSWKQRGL